MSSAIEIPAVKSPTRAGQGRMHLLMLLVTVCWAGNNIAGKEALTGFGDLALAQLRVLATATIFVIGFVASGRWRHLQLSRRKCLFLVATAASGITVNQLAFIGGMARSTVAHAGLISALGPVMVLMIAVVIRLEVLTVWRFTGMFIAFAGVAILTADKAGQGNGGYWVGDLMLLAGALVFAIYTVLVKEIADQFDALTLNALIFMLGAIMMLPFGGRALVRTNWAALSLYAWWGLVFLVVFGSVIAYLAFSYAMTELDASRAAAFNYLQPIITSGLGIWVLAERLTPKVLIGGGFVLAGVYLTERERGEDKVPGNSSERAA